MDTREERAEAFRRLNARQFDRVLGFKQHLAGAEGAGRERLPRSVAADARALAAGRTERIEAIVSSCRRTGTPDSL